jgi:hypothetical protein
MQQSENKRKETKEEMSSLKEPNLGPRVLFSSIPGRVSSFFSKGCRFLTIYVCTPYYDILIHHLGEDWISNWVSGLNQFVDEK